MTIVQVFKTTFRVVHMVYSSRLYPRAEPRGFTLQWIKNTIKIRKIIKKSGDAYVLLFDY